MPFVAGSPPSSFFPELEGSYLHRHFFVLFGLHLDHLQRGELPLDVENLLYSFLLFGLHVVDPRFHCLHCECVTLIAFSVYLFLNLSSRRLICYKLSDSLGYGLVLSALLGT